MIMNSDDLKKFAYIDALRGLAILGVLMAHCGQHGRNTYPQLIVSIISNAQHGVQLFFIVSALTLFMSMKERSNSEKYPYLNFFIRRFFRIAPLFYVAILYYLWEYGLGPRYWLGDALGISIYNIIASATFTNGLNPYWINSLVPGGWTIAVEMTFYLFLPLLYKTVKNLKSALLLTIVVSVISKLLHHVLYNKVLISDVNLWREYLHMYFPSQLPTFLIGVVLFYLIGDQRCNSGNARSFFLSCALLIISILFIAQIITQNVTPKYFYFSIAFAMLTYSLFLNPVKLLVNQFTVFIGKISFSMYITHFAVLYFMEIFNFVDFASNRIVNFVIRYLFLLGTTVGLSFITYTLIEKPGQNTGKRLIKALNK